jgi:hypothetical protein
MVKRDETQAADEKWIEVAEQDGARDQHKH